MAYMYGQFLRDEMNKLWRTADKTGPPSCRGCARVLTIFHRETPACSEILLCVWDMHGLSEEGHKCTSPMKVH
jgi:hypothetical protein